MSIDTAQESQAVARRHSRRHNYPKNAMQLTGARASTGHHFGETPSLSTTWAIVAICAALFFIFALDRATGEAPVQHLYYLPIVFAAFRWGRWSGAGVGLTAIVLYHVANVEVWSFPYRQFDVLQNAVFMAAGVVAGKLADDRRRLHQLAMTDDLTGLHNLRSFEARLATMVRAARESGQSLSLLVLDLDRLKLLNDAHGHLAGAEAVRLVGQTLAVRLPRDAAACRYGGDEFVVALPRSTLADAVAVAEDLRHVVSSLTPELAGVQFAVGTLSISVGAACWNAGQSGALDRSTSDATGETLFRAADQALYAAKNDGRNRVSVAAISPRLVARP